MHDIISNTGGMAKKMKYYILVKKKSANKWLGAIPAKKGISLAKLRMLVNKGMKPGFSYKIISETQLRSMIRTTPTRRVRRAGKKRKIIVRRRRKRR